MLNHECGGGGGGGSSDGDTARKKNGVSNHTSLKSMGMANKIVE